ncbi:extensin-like [Arachis duranensis]|uniref:Extensin-like n=1 Tax=Arachis duranensis TaxID=130453 RepID=A0A6P4BNN3_ARADU|nr:extensin-like [Arachis duranensis]
MTCHQRPLPKPSPPSLLPNPSTTTQPPPPTTPATAKPPPPCQPPPPHRTLPPISPGHFSAPLALIRLPGSASRPLLSIRSSPPPFTATDETATPSAGPSSSTATPATTTAPPPTSEPIYHLVHRLFQQLDRMEHRNRRRYERSERRNRRRYEHLKLLIRSGGDIPSEPDTPLDPSEEEVDEHEEELAPPQAAQAGTEQAAPQQEIPHQIQAADPEIPIQSAPPLQQTNPQTTTTETPAIHPTSDDTPSHPV